MTTQPRSYHLFVSGELRLSSDQLVFLTMGNIRAGASVMRTNPENNDADLICNFYCLE